MAVQKQQSQFIDGDSIPALRIWTWAKSQLEKVEDLYKKRKSEIIKEVAERLESKGFPCEKICHEITKQLSDYVNEDYVREVLPSKYKNQKQSNNAVKSGLENPAKARVKAAIKQAIGGGIECESCAEAYDIEKVKSGVYTYEYLQSLCIWLHETLELNCRGK